MKKIEPYSPKLKPLLEEAAQAYRLRDDDAFAALMREALLLAPQRLDLWYNLANHHVQTGKVDEAIDILRKVYGMIPRDATIMFTLAHWLQFAGQSSDAERLRRTLESARPELAADLLRIWTTIDAWLSKRIDDTFPPPGKGWGKVGIVVLGYRLNADGTMSQPLVDRLEKALEGTKRFDNYRVVVSGGAPRAGVVEAVPMRRWLEEKGVPAECVIEEGYSRDLVENLIYSRHILDILGAESVIAVTSANNVRRAGSGMEILAWINGSSWRVFSTAASGETLDNFSDDGSDRLKLFRDTLRVYGIPMMRTYPELSER